MDYSKIGDKNLRELSNCNNFNEWMYSHLKPNISGNILEVGSGIGNLSQYFITSNPNSKIYLTDIDESYIEVLRAKYGSYKNVFIKNYDLSKSESNDPNEKFDTIIAINVVEHIEDDFEFVNSLKSVLAPKGKIIILVPAHKALFNIIDKEVGHYRRYSKERLIDIASTSKLKLVSIRYFNFITIPAWYISGKMFKQAEIKQGSVKIFEIIVPIVRKLDDFISRHFTGLSLIAVYTNENN